jgi:hypothetical protein
MDWRALDARIKKKVFASHKLQAFLHKRMKEQPAPALGENVLQRQGISKSTTLATADDAPAAATNVQRAVSEHSEGFGCTLHGEGT